MSFRHCQVARSVALLFKKARLYRRTVPLGGGRAHRLQCSLICMLISLHFLSRGLPEGDGVALGYQPLGQPNSSYRYLLAWPRGIACHTSHGRL